MKNWRGAVGTVFITAAMVLMALAGFVYAGPALVGDGVSGTAARSAEPRIVEAGTGQSWTMDEVQEMLADGAGSRVSVQDGWADLTAGIPSMSAAGAALGSSAGLTTPSSTPTQPILLSQKEMKDAFAEASRSKGGDPITIKTSRQDGMRGRWVGGEIDAGGPYGGPDTFETTELRITVTINDPAVIFLRYDYNNDGKIDFPSQVGAGPDGRWTTLTEVTQTYDDNYMGDIRVEGWDGRSRTINVVTGNNHGTEPLTQILWDPANQGMKFVPASDMRVVGLRYFRYVYEYTGFSIKLWEFSTATLLGECAPTQGGNFLEWRECVLATTVDLTAGTEYMVSFHKDADGYPYFPGLLSAYVNSPEIQNQGWWYLYGSPGSMPIYQWAPFYTPKVDFVWEKVTVTPDVTSDAAFAEVHNVAPTVFDIRSNPDPGLEGNPVQLSATMTDPGTGDDWEYQWYIAGVPQGWRPIMKFTYTPVSSARVLILHTWSGDAPSLQSNIISECGSFCTTVDTFDFGPGYGGMNRPPALSEIASYNVVIVGTNYFTSYTRNVGDVLADYMDLGGSVILMAFGFDNAWGDIAGINGRWETDGYSPIPRNYVYTGSAGLGTIYDPAHPLVQGVSALQDVFGFHGTATDVAPGAFRVADYSDGAVLAAVKTNPKVSNGARAIGLSFYPFAPYTTGDYVRMVVNAIHYGSDRGLLRPQPLALDPFDGIFPDDEPTTTPEDTIPVSVEVRDDDDGKLEVRAQDELFSSNFNDPLECSGIWPDPSTWPAGWRADPDGYGWQCGYDYYGFSSRYGPNILWFYNDPNYLTGDGHSYLTTNTFDFSAYNTVILDYFNDWNGLGFPGPSDGVIEASTDGGVSFPFVLAEYHHGATDVGRRSVTSFDLGGESNVVLRFRYESNDDAWWMLDDIKVTAIDASIIQGRGSVEGILGVANVPPTVIGGFDSALRNEAQSLGLNGFVVSDPALNQNTEWFAYAWDYDDGTPVEWSYKGTMAPPQYSVLVLNTLCAFQYPCPQEQWLVADLEGYDDTGIVDTFDFGDAAGLFNPQPPGGLTAWYAGDLEPGMAILRQYDVIVVATRLAYFGYTQWDDARTAVGDLLAQYLDEGRGGVVTFRYAMELDPDFYQDIWALRGRFITDKYSAVERTNSLSFGGDLFGATKLGEIFEPDHDIFDGVRSGEVDAPFTHGADYPVTIGGSNNAAGVNGVVFADWQDGNTALGVKVLLNGARTAHVGGYPWYCGQLTSCAGVDTDRFMRNLAGWFGGGVPTPKVTNVDHVWADNGIYSVDLMIIDDDMGWTWDFAANRPMEALPGMTSIAHRIIEVAVDNVDPVIAPGSIQAFIAAEVCLRVSGTAGNTVTVDVLTDGSLSATTSVTRVGGDPNPPTEKCAMLRIDVKAPHTFSAELTYSRPNGGSNPTWLIFEPWREPVTPGHGTMSLKYDFVQAGTVTAALPNLKQALVDGGQGAKVDFAAEASDVGTDDLAFFWSWGGEAGAIFGPTATSVYTIHVHHNDGQTRTDGVLTGPQYLGFSEPYFDVDANTGRSPAGTTDFRVRDTAMHAFPGGQGLYYVFLMVLDDDNGRGYPSTYGLDGIDIEVIVVDLR